MSSKKLEQKIVLQSSLLLLLVVSTLTITSKRISQPNITLAQTQEDPEQTWPMAGQDVERSSHNNIEVPGGLNPLWFKPIEPYIPPVNYSTV